MVKDFEFFLAKGDVKKQSPNKNLALATFKDGLERIEFAKQLLIKSFSHEASIAHLVKEDFKEQDLSEFDRFRKIRNGIKYYGKDCDIIDTKQAILLADKIITKLKEKFIFK